MTRLAVACFLLVAGACTQPAQAPGATPDAGAAGPRAAPVPLVAARSPLDAADAGPLAAPAQPSDAGQVVRFVALGDTGHGNADQTRVGDAVGALCAAQGCDFVVLLGDNFYPTGVTSTVAVASPLPAALFRITRAWMNSWRSNCASTLYCNCELDSSRLAAYRTSAMRALMG